CEQDAFLFLVGNRLQGAKGPVLVDGWHGSHHVFGPPRGSESSCSLPEPMIPRNGRHRREARLELILIPVMFARLRGFTISGMLFHAWRSGPGRCGDATPEGIARPTVCR